MFDDLEKPVGDAFVIVQSQSTYHVAEKQHDATIQGLQHMSARSDAQGHFSLEALPQSEALLQVGGARSCELWSEPIDLRKDVEKDIQLKCHPTFRVIVQDGSARGIDHAMMDEVGVPIKNFTIRLHKTDVDSYSVWFPFVSDDGSFSLKHIPTGKVSIEVAADLMHSDKARTVASFTQDAMVVEGQTTFLLAVLKRQGSFPAPHQGIGIRRVE